MVTLSVFQPPICALEPWEPKNNTTFLLVLFRGLNEINRGNTALRAGRAWQTASAQPALAVIIEKCSTSPSAKDTLHECSCSLGSWDARPGRDLLYSHINFLVSFCKWALWGPKRATDHSRTMLSRERVSGIMFPAFFPFREHPESSLALQA